MNIIEYPSYLIHENNARFYAFSMDELSGAHGMGKCLQQSQVGSLRKHRVMRW